MSHASKHEDGLFSEQATRYLLSSIPTPALQRLFMGIVGDHVVRIGAISRKDDRLALKDVLVVAGACVEFAEEITFSPTSDDQYIDLRAVPATVNVGDGRDLTRAGLILELHGARACSSNTVAGLHWSAGTWAVDPSFWPEHIAVGADPRSHTAFKTIRELWPLELFVGTASLRLANPNTTTWAELLPTLLSELAKSFLGSGVLPAEIRQSLSAGSAALATTITRMLHEFSGFPPTIAVGETVFTRGLVYAHLEPRESIRLNMAPGCIPVLLLSRDSQLHAVHGRCNWNDGGQEFVLTPGRAAAATTDVPVRPRWCSLELLPRAAAEHTRVALYHADPKE